ncbi:hypothetical protein [Acetobacterium bakii]|uniref:hypothetical protein n=1 Tax=Acetobacterium bakii TaxID=52689 RepID=UPI000F8CB55D|nr:hypothetical protein [Acetobacterium bakii]
MRATVELIIHPKRFFEMSKNREISVRTPIIILILIGIVDGLVVANYMNHTTIYEVITSVTPVITGTTILFSMLMGSFWVYALILVQTVLFNLIMKKWVAPEPGSRLFIFLVCQVFRHWWKD